MFKQFDRGVAQGGMIGYSDFLEEVRSKRIKTVQLQEGPGGSTEIRARTTDDKELRTTATYLDRGLVGDLINNGIKFDVKPREEPSFLLSMLASWRLLFGNGQHAKGSTHRRWSCQIKSPARHSGQCSQGQNQSCCARRSWSRGCCHDRRYPTKDLSLTQCMR